MRVERILSADGRVTGVASADERFAAAIVIADVMPGALAADGATCPAGTGRR